VIEGGTLPQGWQPTLVPYQGVGPDGKPITVMIAPTYVFTLNPLPAQAQPVVPGPAAGGVAAAQAASQPQVAAKPAPPVAAPAAPPPSVPYGSNWVFQTQGVQPAPTGLAASSPPAPSPAQMAWGGSPLSQPAPPYGSAAAAAAATAVAASPPSPPQAVVAAQPPSQPQQYGAALQPPPSQWGPAIETGPFAAVAATAAPPAMAAAVAEPAPLSPDPVMASIGGQPPPPVSPPAAAAPPASADPDPPLRAAAPTPPLASEGHRWRVVGVVDGDLVTCIDDAGGQHKVRLAEIDAPDMGQDYGKAAREKLADLVFGKTVQVVDQGKDRSGRWIARLYVDGLDVNRELVAQGAAWHYAAASSDPSLDDLQRQAQSRQLGLWAQPDPVPPWQWRQQ
jgi:endonuclease YncB( thermonuclease family)